MAIVIQPPSFATSQIQPWRFQPAKVARSTRMADSSPMKIVRAWNGGAFHTITNSLRSPSAAIEFGATAQARSFGELSVRREFHAAGRLESFQQTAHGLDALL